VAAVEIEPVACETLRRNRPAWDVIETDVRQLKGHNFKGIDLLAAGVPCPPFSIAGKQLGNRDERDLFPEALRLVSEIQPRAVMLENVPGFASDKFADYRRRLAIQFGRLGYEVAWRVLNACDFGVPQLRPRFVIVAFRKGGLSNFIWPEGAGVPTSVGEALFDLMASRGWQGAIRWAAQARAVAPTLVGGSKKHGGPDLGPTRARKQWKGLGVDGLGLADESPSTNSPANMMPRLTVRMAARVQGFPDDWTFSGKKTAAYRQVGNAFPPPVAKAVGTAIRAALAGAKSRGREVQMRLFSQGAF